MAYACYIGGVQRFSTEDGPGIRTTVFFKGCPLGCQWCHNPELMNGGHEILYRAKECILCGRCVAACPSGALTVGDGHVDIDRALCRHCGACVKACCTGALFTKAISYTAESLMALIEKDRQFYESSGGGVTFSGGEVLFHAPYALELAGEVRKHGLSLAIETSGYGSYEELFALAGLCDWVLFDLKHMDPDRHREFVGAAPDTIWANLEGLAADGAIRPRIIIRVPMIGGVNDTAENMAALAGRMNALGLETVHLLPYHKMGVSKAREAGRQQREFETPSDETLEAAKKILTDAGLAVTVMGHED